MNAEYTVVFYEDAAGRQPVVEYMRKLQGESGKDARIKLNKIRDYVKLLKLNGPRLTEPYCKHLEGEIYELRPASNRILYAGWLGHRYVLLHVFAKKTQKTPRREIEKAKRELEDFKARFGE
ncbi:MAG: type II toxin-antitoxin system RelE/ParE family toxin [Clostridia bacterium]|nr:type II toxin-antitoxin system RelE/ParE family toxin [Clostridia bacterium]